MASVFDASLGIVDRMRRCCKKIPGRDCACHRLAVVGGFFVYPADLKPVKHDYQSPDVEPPYCVARGYFL
jgi:hypothetical protein